MKRKIIYLVNPISGTKRKSSLLPLISKRTREKNLAYAFMDTSADGNYDHLKKKIIEEQVTDVVVCGGDGTVSAIAAALKGIDINIGIIPLGSGNGLALAAKIPLVPMKALDIIFNGTASWIDGFYINDQFSCMLCGIGFDAKVAHEFAKQTRRGLKTYMKVSLMQLFSAQPYAFEIQTDEASFSTDAFFICIANGNQFGNNFTIAPQASLTDGLLDVVIVKRMNKLALPYYILKQVIGNNRHEQGEYFKKKNVIYFQTPQLTLKNEQAAPLHIDGDPRETAPSFTIRLEKNALKLIQP